MVLLSFFICIPYLLYNNNYKIIINDINNIKKNNDFSIIGLLFIFVTLFYLICQYNYIVSLDSGEYKLAIDFDKVTGQDPTTYTDTPVYNVTGIGGTTFETYL